MKKLLFILSISILLGNEIIGQVNTSEDLSSYIFYTDYGNEVMRCNYVLKINKIENDSIYYVSIVFSDRTGGKGYIYLSNQDELNRFIQDLKEATLNIDKEPFSSITPKYNLQIEDVNKSNNKIKNEIIVYEKGNKKSYVVLNVDDVNKLLHWLSSISFK
jgi:hypothetical protein